MSKFYHSIPNQVKKMKSNLWLKYLFCNLLFSGNGLIKPEAQ